MLTPTSGQASSLAHSTFYSTSPLFTPEIRAIFGPDSYFQGEGLLHLPPLLRYRFWALSSQDQINPAEASHFLRCIVRVSSGKDHPHIHLHDWFEKTGIALPASLHRDAERSLNKGHPHEEVSIRTALAFLLHLIHGNNSASSLRPSPGHPVRDRRFERRERLKWKLIFSLYECESSGDLEPGWASKVEECRNQFSIYAAPDCTPCTQDHRVLVRPCSCGFPLCPHCQHRRSVRLRAELELLSAGMVRRARDTGVKVKFITLTVPNMDSLQGGKVYELIRGSFTKLRHRKRFKERCSGGVYVIETTNKGNGWHVHIHFLATCLDWDQHDLAREWKSCLPKEWQRLVEKAQPKSHRDRAVVWIKDADHGSVREMSKYLVKGSGFYDHPRLIAEYFRSTRRKRLFESSGWCRGTISHLRKQDRKERVAEFVCPHGHALGRVDVTWSREVLGLDVTSGFVVVPPQLFQEIQARREGITGLPP